MKKTFLLLPSLLVLVVATTSYSQPSPVYEATTTQTAAGVVGAPFYISPRDLASFTFVATNLPLATFTNYVNTVSNNVYGTATNSSIQVILGYFPGITNAFAFTNGPPVAGQALVIIGTNAAGMVLVKGTNWPVGGSGSGSLFPPDALGVLTNNGTGGTNWSTSIPGTWVGTGTLPPSALDTSFMPKTNVIASTNASQGSILPRQVPLSTGVTNTYGALTFNVTNLFVTDLEFHIATNAFTNVVIGEIGPLTNKDGQVFWIPVGTNQ